MDFLKKHALPLIFIALLACSLHLFFLKDSIPFLYSGGDPFDQFAKFQRFLYTNYRDWNIEWSWLNGFGGDLIGQFNYYYATSLFFLIKLFFPMGSFLQLADISLYVSIGKVILAGSFFYFYMIYCHRTRTSSLIGALVYVGSIKFMQFSFFSDYMSDAFVFLPLVMWGLDRLLKLGKPTLFIFMIFCIAQSNFYFAYITTIYIGIYTIIYLLTIKNEQSIKALSKKGLSVGFAYIAGILLAAFSFFPAVYQFLSAYRFSKEYPIPRLFPVDFYLNMPVGLFLNITMITIPAIIVLVMFAAIQFRKSIPAIHLWTALIFFIFYQIPFMYSVFNGFSAMQSRWTYLLIFAIAILTAYTLDEWRTGKRIHPSVFILYYSYLVYALIGRVGLESLLQFENAWLIISIHIALPVLFLIRQKKRSWALVAMLALLLVLVASQQNNFFRDQLKDPLTYKENITKVMNAYDEDDGSKEVVQWLQNNDPDFSRYAWYLPYAQQIGDFRQHNNSMIHGLPSLSYYHSLLTSDLGKFIYEDFRIKQFDSFSHFYNVDERLFLETYLQANYMIVNKAFDYRPAGYSRVHTTSAHTIYQLDAPMPFAYLQNNVIHTNDFDDLTVGSRDMLLLQAYRSIDETTNHPLTMYDLPTTLFTEAQPFQQSNHFVDEENVLSLENETIFNITLSEIPTETSQLLASFTIEEVNGEAFTLKIGNTYMEKREEANTYSLPLKDFTLHIDEAVNSDELTLTLSKGTYRLSDLQIEMLPFEHIKSYQEKAIDNSFELVMMHKNKVGLTGYAKESGMLVTSIPYSRGWNVTIDGKKAETDRINEAFLGIPLDEGNTHIELTYHSPFLRTGLSLSILTLLGLVLVGVWRRKRA